LLQKETLKIAPKKSYQCQLKKSFNQAKGIEMIKSKKVSWDTYKMDRSPKLMSFVKRAC
jgi:hypothetical protein